VNVLKDPGHVTRDPGEDGRVSTAAQERSEGHDSDSVRLPAGIGADHSRSTAVSTASVSSLMSSQAELKCGRDGHRSFLVLVEPLALGRWVPVQFHLLQNVSGCTCKPPETPFISNYHHSPNFLFPFLSSRFLFGNVHFDGHFFDGTTLSREIFKKEFVEMSHLKL
jgi:hypothetical protein